MRLDRTINLGSVVTWIVLLIGFVVGYAKMEGDVTRNKEDILDMRSTSASQTAKVNNLETNVGIIKFTVEQMDKKIDQLGKR